MTRNACTIEYALAAVQLFSKWGRMDFPFYLKLIDDYGIERSITGRTRMLLKRPSYYIPTGSIIREERCSATHSEVRIGYPTYLDYDVVLFLFGILSNVMEKNGEITEIAIQHTSEEQRMKAIREDQKTLRCNFLNGTLLDGCIVKHCTSNVAGIKFTMRVSGFTTIIEDQWDEEYGKCVRQPIISQEGKRKEYKILNPEENYIFTLVLKQ